MCVCEFVILYGPRKILNLKKVSNFLSHFMSILQTLRIVLTEKISTLACTQYFLNTESQLRILCNFQRCPHFHKSHSSCLGYLVIEFLKEYMTCSDVV